MPSMIIYEATGLDTIIRHFELFINKEDPAFIITLRIFILLTVLRTHRWITGNINQNCRSEFKCITLYKRCGVFVGVTIHVAGP